MALLFTDQSITFKGEVESVTSSTAGPIGIVVSREDFRITVEVGPGVIERSRALKVKDEVQVIGKMTQISASEVRVAANRVIRSIPEGRR